MSGFGLRALKKADATNDGLREDRYIKHMVVGENLYAYLTFEKLNGKYPGEVLWLTKNLYLGEQIKKDFECSMQSVRSAEVADEMSFNELTLNSASQTALFYKDTKFHSFGARAKPHNLKAGEEFFTQAFHAVTVPVLLDDEQIQAAQVNKIIRSIRTVSASDLVEPTHYEIYSGEQERFRCERVYFCESPRRFYQLVENKAELNESLQKYLVGVENHPGITVYFECRGQFTEHEGSLLIPQSMTHDWGSFILDIEAFDGTFQNFKALTFVNEDDLQEEDLAKKIRLMRKVLERVLPQLEQCEYRTKIKYDPALRMCGMNDELAPELRSEAVRLLGPGAPIIHPESDKFQYFARGSMSISQL